MIGSLGLPSTMQSHIQKQEPTYRASLLVRPCGSSFGTSPSGLALADTARQRSGSIPTNVSHVPPSCCSSSSPTAIARRRSLEVPIGGGRSRLMAASIVLIRIQSFVVEKRPVDSGFAWSTSRREIWLRSRHISWRGSFSWTVGAAGVSE